MFKRLLPSLFCMLFLNLAHGNDPSSKTIYSIIETLNITMKDKYIQISTRCQGVPSDLKQTPLPTCDKVRDLTTRVKNIKNTNKQNICHNLQKTFQTFIKDCIPYCQPCKYRYSG